MKYGELQPRWRVAFYADYKASPDSQIIWSSGIAAWSAEDAVEKFIQDGDPYCDGDIEKFVAQNILGDYPNKHSRPIEVITMRASLVMEYSFDKEERT